MVLGRKLLPNARFDAELANLFGRRRSGQIIDEHGGRETEFQQAVAPQSAVEQLLDRQLWNHVGGSATATYYSRGVYRTARARVHRVGKL